MTATSLLAAADATCTQATPDGNFGGRTQLSVASGSSGAGRQTYMYFNQPFPAGVTILSATLNWYQKGVAAGGSRTITVRRLSAGFKESTITYNNAPGIVGSAATATQGNGGTDGRAWVFDVTALMQEVADGAAWYGFRLQSDNTTNLFFFGRESNQYLAALDVEWSDAPAAPSDLSPDGGRAVSVARPTLRFDFTDVANADASLIAVQVQLNGTDSWTSPSHDSGTVAATIPQWALNFDVSVGDTWFWRARVQESSGVWSDWSESATFTRTAKPTVAITSPAPSPNNIVYQPRPTISWTVSGATQRAYQIFLTDPDDLSDVLWTSGKTSSSATSVTLPSSSTLFGLNGVSLTPGRSYGLRVRVWDTESRESTPDDPVYADASMTFSYGVSNTVPGVAALTAAVVAVRPEVTLTWTRATAPDSFVILSNGEVLQDGLDPSDVHVSGTSYQFVQRLVRPQLAHDFQVLCVAAGTTSQDNMTATATTAPEGVWLLDPDTDTAVCISGVDNIFTGQASEDVTIHKPIGADNPVMITQSIRGMEGSVSGSLQGNAPGLESVTIADWVGAFDALTAKNRRGETLALILTDTAMRVQVYNVYRGPAEEFTEASEIPVSFDFVRNI